MSTIGKLEKFRQNLTFKCLLQPRMEEVFRTDYRLKGKWHQEFFQNDNPITLELGCGKGEYTVALAKLYPDRNFIGIDIKGARLWKGAREVEQLGLKNVCFVRTNIDFIEWIFGKDEIDSFIDEMSDMGDEWQPEDVERVYGDKSLEDALADRRHDLTWLGGIIGTLLNHGNN